MVICILKYGKDCEILFAAVVGTVTVIIWFNDSGETLAS